VGNRNMGSRPMGKYDDVPLGHQIAYARHKFDVEGQPKWSVPDAVVIEAAISGDHYQNPARRKGTANARELAKQEALLAVGAGASAIHFSAYDKDGNRSGELADYQHMVGAVRDKFGYAFLANCNSLYGKTFEDKLSAVLGGLAEEAVVNCVHRFHPRFLQASVEVMEANGCRPHLTVRDTIEIGDCHHHLIKPGYVRKPYSWLIYPNFDGIPFPDARAMHTGLQFMVDRIRDIDPASVIMVGCNGRASIFLCATAMIMGLNVRVGMEDSNWLYPHRDETCPDNGVAVARAVELANMFGRRPATGDDYRQILGLRPKGNA
jgi:3-keto-5-aminohexanoate cleavage enzyme